MNRTILTFLIGLAAACGEVKGDDDGIDAPPDECAAPNVCECTVNTEDADCGAHEFCNVGGPGRSCECVAGYTNGGSGCVFTGELIKDVGFQDPAQWTSVRGALVNSSAVGSVEPGEATFLPATLCDLSAITQTYEAPRFAKAEPLVLELSYKNQFNAQAFEHAHMGISFNGGWGALRAFTDANFHTVRICLPESAYAPSASNGKSAPVEIAFGPYLPPSRCPGSQINNFAVDHADIVKANANECGTKPGEGANFDAEGEGGWFASTTGDSALTFVSGIGVGGSRVARLNLRERCDSVFMETFFNVPDIANPSLEVFVGTNAGGASADVRLGPSVGSFGLFETLPPAPAGSSGTLRMCLPPSLRGQTMAIGFSVSGGNGSCADVVNNQVFADEVRVVDDVTCSNSANMANPGFEGNGLPFGAFGSTGSSTAVARTVTNAAQAHGGTKFLALESFGRCSKSGYVMLPTVPPSAGANGPALTFFANVGVNANASTTLVANGTSTPLTEGGGYIKYTVCLEPLFVGRPQIVEIRHDGGIGLCDNSNYPQQNVFIDDVEVTTDPSCPAQ